MQFNSRENPEAFRQIMTGTTGGAVCVIVFWMAVYMIIKSTGQIKNIKVQELGEIR